MKEYFKRFFKNKFNIVLLSLVVLTIILSALSYVNKGFMFAALISIAGICFTIAIKMIFDYRHFDRKVDEAELHAQDVNEVQKINRKRKSVKGDMIFQIIMFIIFGILFLIATTKVY